jgi:hypothetical protein
MAVSFASVPLLVKNDFVRLRLRRKHRRHMLQRVHLGMHFAVHFFIAVAHADGHDAAKKIQILVAVGVPDVLILGARYDQRLFVIMENRGEKIFAIREENFILSHFF